MGIILGFQFLMCIGAFNWDKKLLKTQNVTFWSAITWDTYWTILYLSLISNISRRFGSLYSTGSVQYQLSLSFFVAMWAIWNSEWDFSDSNCYIPYYTDNFPKVVEELNLTWFLLLDPTLTKESYYTCCVTVRIQGLSCKVFLFNHKICVSFCMQEKNYILYIVSRLIIGLVLKKSSV